MVILDDLKNIDILKLLETDKEQLLQQLDELPAAEIKDLIHGLEYEEQLLIIRLFNREKQGEVVTELGLDIQMWLFNNTQIYEFARIFTHLSSDIRADIFQNLEKDEQSRLLPYLDKKTRVDVINLSSYHPETAGGIMITDFADIMQKMTVQEALEKIRKDSPSKKMIYYIYVVDKEMKLLGFVTLKDLIMSEPGISIEDILHDNYIYAEADEDRESVAHKIEKYDLIAIPVINPLHQLLGIVTHDDAIEVIRAEQTEDMEKIMGINHSNEGVTYMDSSSFEHFKKRIWWIMSLSIVGIISGMIIHKFETTLEKLIILALYMPMVADTGGNIGSQSATVVIRALALGHISLKDWFLVVWKELRIALMISCIIGGIAFLKVMFLSYETTIPSQFTIISIAFVISLALSFQAISSAVIGALLPLMVKFFGGDPAVAASPAITTIVDITGLLIYFTTATIILGV
ncbi:MAG: magnesium transporter [Spirochaetes bacterium GWF1_31_7]|nr:MAG: magnesium transporter [Spirochaetes bacterium GWE1_32_154]OHD46941.1 MAG: magnesium transporter [Spirochaetes bacterium GWF1_31_7]OHD48719.1 MAG: magnesium transporter [Spirochaetes bacterium GWE2_31_10]OHD82593.1 MAG: magnesium transporter [Spirochaetes bacterium RIFOXYB1_FULL_32_8]HBD95552.1 magnesium transporter [Spirochaetia bacterium]